MFGQPHSPWPSIILTLGERLAKATSFLNSNKSMIFLLVYISCKYYIPLGNLFCEIVFPYNQTFHYYVD